MSATPRVARPPRATGLVPFVLVVLMAGCQHGEPAATVTGTITYKGKPVEHGQIMFHPQAGNAPSTTGEITNGTYTAKAKPGSMRVEIQAFKELSRTGTGQPLIPPNAQGNFRTVEVKEGSQTLDFALE